MSEVDSANAPIERRDEPCTDAMKADWTERIPPRYERKQGAAMPILHDVQHAYRHVPYQAMMEIASFPGITPAEVLDTVSFYEEYTTGPWARVIGTCQSIACEVCGHQALDHCRDTLGVEVHETTEDGLFTLLALECLGSCDTAPVALFNETLHEKLTIETVDELIARVRQGGGESEH